MNFPSPPPVVATSGHAGSLSLRGADERATRQLDFIQALRGVAVLLVVSYHYQHFLDGKAFWSLGPRLFEHGTIGVNLFFVLSGFIMVFATQADGSGPGMAVRFAIKRLTRIAPPYVFWTLVMWLVTRGLPNPAFDVDGLEWIRTLSFQPLEPGSAAPFFGYPLLYVGWSLSYEMYFYGMFAASLLAPGRWRWVALLGLAVTGLVAVPALSGRGLHADALLHYHLPGMLNVAANPLIWEFLAGVVIGHLFLGPARIRDRGLAGSLLALALGVVLWQYAAGVRSGHGVTRAGPSVIALVLFAALYAKSYPVRVPAWLRWVGDVSYSLYLVHVIPTMIARHHKAPTTSGMAMFVACFVLSLVTAYWSHRLLERGVCEWLKDAALRPFGRGEPRPVAPLA